MKEHDIDQRLLGRIKTGLDDGLERLDPAISRRLGESRRGAVNQPGRFRLPGLGALRLVPFTGTATAIAIMTVFTLWYAGRPANIDPRGDEVELVAAQGNLEMYKDLDFYSWLAKNDDTR